MSGGGDADSGGASIDEAFSDGDNRCHTALAEDHFWPLEITVIACQAFR
jgi:hypothetical protein